MWIPCWKRLIQHRCIFLKNVGRGRRTGNPGFGDHEEGVRWRTPFHIAIFPESCGHPEIFGPLPGDNEVEARGNGISRRIFGVDRPKTREFTQISEESLEESGFDGRSPKRLRTE